MTKTALHETGCDFIFLLWNGGLELTLMHHSFGFISESSRVGTWNIKGNGRGKILDGNSSALDIEINIVKVPFTYSRAANPSSIVCLYFEILLKEFQF